MCTALWLFTLLGYRYVVLPGNNMRAIDDICIEDSIIGDISWTQVNL
jgi:hypothetical protein